MPRASPDKPLLRGLTEGATGSVRAVLLGLVLERPGYGYDLANRLVKRLGETWKIAHKDVYRLLDELTDRGLLESREERPSGRKQSLVFFYPTPLTASVLGQWIETLSPKEPMREAIRAKVAAAREEDARSLLLSLKEYERHCLVLARLTPSATNVSAWSGIVVDCARDAIASQLRAEVEWCRRTRRRIQRYLAERPD